MTVSESVRLKLDLHGKSGKHQLIASMKRSNVAQEVGRSQPPLKNNI